MIVEILLVLLGWVLGIATIFLMAFLIPRENVEMNRSAYEQIKKNAEENASKGLMPPFNNVAEKAAALHEKYLAPEIGETSAMKSARKLAIKYGWREVMHDLHSCTLSFKKNGDRVNVYYTTMTVGTAINHPSKGKTQLFRKRISWEEMEKIFANPRIHTKKGYYEK